MSPLRQVEEKMRMRADIELPSEYMGRVVSRSKALKSAGRPKAKRQESDDDESEASSDLDGADSDDGENDGEDQAGGSEEEDQEGARDGMADASDEEEEEEDEEDEEEDESMREVEELEAEQEANLIKLVQVEDKDRQKAQHARNQRALSDTVLEARIRMQKPLALAARLPRGDAMTAFCKKAKRTGDAGVSFASLANECRTEASELVEDLLALRTGLWAQNPALPAPGEWKTRRETGEEDGGGVGKRKREDEVAALWERVSAADEALVPFRDATVDKWNSKVMLGSGAKAGNKFKALNQTVLNQITNTLQVC